VLRATGDDFGVITDVSAVAAELAPVFTNEGVALADPLTLRLTSRAARATETLTCAAPSVSERFLLGGAPLPSAALLDWRANGA